MDAKTERLNALIERVVELPVAERRLELGRPDGAAVDQAERRRILTVLVPEMEKAIGIDRLEELPPVVIDQFCIMSVLKNHDTQGLLRSLVNSFMAAYIVPETSEAAYAFLQGIEQIRHALVSRVDSPLQSNHSLH